MISVVIIEDLTDYREAMKLLLNGTLGFTCMADYANAEDAIKEIPSFKPGVALVDINLPSMNGIELIKLIRKKSPGTLCMVCTAYDEDEKVFSALQAGAHSYILKSTAPGKILEAILELYNGGSPMSSQVARKVVAAFTKAEIPDDNYSLTNREKEVLEQLAKGLLYKEIAFQLAISLETVRRHCFNIYEKLHVHNRTEALNKYFRNE
jgi:two-component system, NarL family, response regulator LiaR